MNPVFAMLLAAALSLSWTNQQSNSTASLRGVCAVNSRVAWASGTGGAYLRTTDGGETWRAAVVPGAQSLDFRAVRAFDENTAYLLSIGTGAQSRIYRTEDAGSHWTLKLSNPDPTGFFDALAFWDRQHGIVLGDPVDGHLVVLTTDDEGENWRRQSTPPALKGEGAFAASNTCLTVMRTPAGLEAWFATGGPGAARVFHSLDSGRSWTVATTPIRNDSASAGVFSLAFADAGHGVAVGGDYAKPGEDQHNVALTSDGGRTWLEPKGPRPRGFRSAVAFLPAQKMWIAAGPTGSDVSYDGGESWTSFDSGAFNAASFAPGGSGWAVGPKGSVARFRLK